jgi:hypothetical protein
MQRIFSYLHWKFTINKFPYLTILSNIFLGFAFGRILVTPGDDLSENTFVKAFLVIGACLFFNYLGCIRKAWKGIIRDIHGRLRPFLREALFCAALNGFILIFSLSLFFLKSRYL